MKKKHCEWFRKYVTAEHFFEVNLDYSPHTHTKKKDFYEGQKKFSRNREREFGLKMSEKGGGEHTALQPKLGLK